TPMPPIQQQQTSRGGLITSLVIAIIMAVGFLVWGIMTNADLTKAQAAEKRITKQYEPFVSADKLGNVEALKAEFSPSPTALRPTSMLILDMASEQRKALIKAITGAPDGTEDSALKAVADVYARVKANADLGGAAIPETSLVAALDAINTQITAKEQ